MLSFRVAGTQHGIQISMFYICLKADILNLDNLTDAGGYQPLSLLSASQTFGAAY